jgi:hypothetical protein
MPVLLEDLFKRMAVAGIGCLPLLTEGYFYHTTAFTPGKVEWVLQVAAPFLS